MSGNSNAEHRRRAATNATDAVGQTANGSGRRRGASTASHTTWNGMRVTPTVHSAAGYKEVKVDRGPSGLGGNTRGSEGYGELTHGSMSRLILLLRHLRETVLCRLSPGHGKTAWSAEYDLGPDSIFVDIGSGYGKAVVHTALLGGECTSNAHL